MLNLAIGTAQDVDGRTCILSGAVLGHAVYGPFDLLDAGRYAVGFHLELMPSAPIAGDELCAVVEVATDSGHTMPAFEQIRYSRLANGETDFTLEFELSKACRVEYRVWVSGKVPLLIDDYHRAVRVTDDQQEAEAVIADEAFPVLNDAAPSFFRENVSMFRSFYQQGMDVAIVGDSTVLTVEGVSMHARSRDDLNFIGEVFHQHAYNLKSDRPVAVVDVGMNIGLTSLMLATKSEVAEVHAFEPFVDTYQRAVANIGLNPGVASKIQAHNFGLSDKDWDGALAVNASDDSGSRSTIAVPNGQQIHITLRSASETLGPIIEQAEARGLSVVVKLDCEGSEFAIVRSLAEAGLIGRISAFMVEWHAMFAELDQNTLLAPLRAAGFLVFDQSPPVGNGFFYAVRMA
jgi:FkbM family methyltransferase